MSVIEARLFQIAAAMAEFEIRTLCIPPSLRFFGPGAPSEVRCQEAAVLLVISPHMFFTMPILDRILGRNEPARGNTIAMIAKRYLGYLIFFCGWTMVFWQYKIIARQLR
ncbi:hypothetical protein EJ04DRAFT_557760 [Polyplosphaeria fusca]|uniref:Uncharacterized protein n=1 Tax=Polyplosphaeria fusca TaxID=682080 RepID=A0A9P4UVI9_9PLEO|nr:hypothetical protein EJ04DRAFT_557760 [Polyplosphaeria fusca]